MSLYEFDVKDAERFASVLGIKYRTKNRQMEFVWCPYCKGGGKDKGTFYLSTETGQFECKRAGCGMKGNMITLSQDFSDRFELSNDVSRYFAMDKYTDDNFRKFVSKHLESTDNAIEYISSRGISQKICEWYEITSKEQHDNIIVFPFKDEEGNLRFIKYRNTEYQKDGSNGSKEWCEKDCMPILFGMYQCNLNNETLVITEGQIDSLSVAESGIENAVSVPTGAKGFTWVPHCWNWLHNFKDVVVFGDYEHGKVTLSEELTRRLSSEQIKVRIVQPEDYKDCKDANEILQKYGKQAIIDAVNNAKSKQSCFIKDISEVERVDIMSMQVIPTGIKSVDDLLSGGFHLGELVVLTGKRGQGKSTFASQCICNALSDGIYNPQTKESEQCNVFVYSGELKDFYFKNWLDTQLLGTSKPHQSALNKLNAWYKGRMFIYNNDAFVDSAETETDNLLKIIEKAILELDVKFIVIDNLMTAITINPYDNEYTAQALFVEQLAKICKKNNVCICLVAHPRKNDIGDDNDSVSGSSKITDRADVVMKYQSPKDNIPAPRQLVVSKNRLTGKITGKNPIDLYFQEHSKRIADDVENFEKNYLKITENDLWKVEDVPF